MAAGAPLNNTFADAKEPEKANLAKSTRSKTRERVRPQELQKIHKSCIKMSLLKTSRNQ